MSRETDSRLRELPDGGAPRSDVSGIEIDNYNLLVKLHGVSVSIHDFTDDQLTSLAELCEMELKDRFYRTHIPEDCYNG